MKPEDRVTWSKELREQIERPRSESLVERCRALRDSFNLGPRIMSGQDARYLGYEEFRSFLEEVLAALIDYESLLRIRDNAPGDGELEGESEERASQERRTLAKAQMACRLFEGYAAVAGLTTEERIQTATHVAEEILRACEGERPE